MQWRWESLEPKHIMILWPSQEVVESSPGTGKKRARGGSGDPWSSGHESGRSCITKQNASPQPFSRPYMCRLHFYTQVLVQQMQQPEIELQSVQKCACTYEITEPSPAWWGPWVPHIFSQRAANFPFRGQAMGNSFACSKIPNPSTALPDHEAMPLPGYRISVAEVFWR